MTPPGQGWSSYCWLALLLFTSLCGCRNTTDTVEMALRAREKDLRVLKEEVYRLNSSNAALVCELHAIRQSAGGSVGDGHPGNWPGITPEYAAQTYTLKRITLGRGTGGMDEDKHPGDEVLQVIIEPRDFADDVIKAPGAAQVSALEISPEGMKTPLSAWAISADQMRTTWKQGLFSTGYVLALPWQQKPRHKNVRVTVRFQLSDGRVFEADKDITINPGPMMLPAAPPLPGIHEPLWPKPGETLPLPKEVKPPYMPPAAPVLQPAGIWQPANAGNAVQMLRPEPLYPTRPD